MNETRRWILAAAVLLNVGLLGAKEYPHIVLYKDCGTWTNNAAVIQSGVDSGRIAWDGKALKFVPRGGGFDLKDIYCFGFVMRVPENMKNQRFSVKFTYEEGKPVVWNLRAPEHIGWKSFLAKITDKSWPYVRQGKLKAVEFSTEAAKFQAVLDDIRFVRHGVDFQLHDEWVPAVTDGCFFPEYMLEQQRTETLNDPEFKAKMAEIERLRHSKLRATMKKEHTNPKELLGLPLISRIRPDGSVKGLSYEEVMKINKQMRLWRDGNETFIQMHCELYTPLLSYWEWGRVPRTGENRRKLFKSLIRTLTAEINRRGETSRSVVPGFVVPSMAAFAYGVFFDEMEAVEKGTNTDPDAILLNRLLKEAVSMCYYQPLQKTAGPALTEDSFSHSSDWTGGNFAYRPTFMTALICRNPKMLDVISEVARKALTRTSWNTLKTSFWVDAITADGAAWGHGPQNYSFGYPLNGVSGIGRLIGNLSGSRWELKNQGAAFDSVCGYFEALLWHGTGWAKNDRRHIKAKELLQRDIPAACGRRAQIYREGKGYDDFGYALQTVNVFLGLVPDGSVQKKRLQHCADVICGKIRDLPEGTRYFWNNDLLICREKESLAVIGMLSSRVLSVECAPCNSHLNDFWSCGSAWIMKHFDSYRIARGFMKTCATPGVTSRQWEVTHPGQYWRWYRGIFNFAGGAVDGKYAVCGFRMGLRKDPKSPDPNFYDLEADKSYFWLNGKLLCIGTGITDKAGRGVPVATTVDQTLWRGPAQDITGTTRKPGDTFQAETQLLWHDGVGYAVLNGKGKLSGETRKDRWLDFDGNNRTAKNLPKSAPMLMFQIDHGKNPQNGSYAYAVDFHSPDFTSLKKLAEKPPFEIVSATPEAHVVREKSSGTLAAVFFKPGEAGGLKVDAPAVVLLRQTPDGKARLTVNDPEQSPKRDSVTVGWNGKVYKIQLPTGLYCGQPVTVDL